MKPTRLLIALLLLPALRTLAQCSFTPTVTPNNLILCPNSQDTIWTQTSDSYQWYKDNVLLPGATNRYYVVDAFQDSGSEFKVAATQAGCTATSANVLVDGWAFLPVSVVSRGGATGFAIDPSNGSVILCDSTRLHARDTLYLTVNAPYTTGVKWYRNGGLLPGVSSPTLKIAEAGSYYVEGAPATCPNYGQRSLPVEVVVRQPTRPLITQVGSQLQANPPAGQSLSSYQWYLNGVAIGGATSNVYNPTTLGTYWVQAEDPSCYTISSPFQLTALAARGSALAQQTSVYPNPTRGLVYFAAPVRLTATLYSLTGQAVRTAAPATTLDLHGLPDGMYLLQLRGPDGAIVKTEKLVKAAQE
jgi:hypothetical protein